MRSSKGAGVTAERGLEKVERGRQWGLAKAKRGRRWNVRKRSAVLNFGVIARRGPKKTRRGLKVQRSPNFKFNFGPCLALDHA